MKTSMEISAPIPPKQPIYSLGELRRQHSALLQRQSAGSGTTKPTHGEVLGFLEAASQLGRQLESLEERDSAQSIMDYWLATVLSEFPELTQTSSSLTLFPFDENGYVEFSGARKLTKERAANAAENTQNISVKLDKEQKQTLQRLLLRFLRLKENSLEAYSVPLPDKDEILKDPTVKNLLTQLIDAGAIRQRANDTADSEVYELVHDRLIFEWDFFKKITEQRRAFRDVANGWNGGERRKEGLLLGGDQLSEAGDYLDLSSCEREFYDASRRAMTDDSRSKLKASGILLLIVSIILGGVCYQYEETKELNVKLLEALEKTNQAYAISLTTASQIYSIQEQVIHYKVEMPTGNAMDTIDRVVSRMKNNNVPIDLNKPKFELFVPLTVADPEITFLPYIDAIQKAGFEIPAGGSLPRKTQEDDTKIRYYYAEDLPLAQEIERILREQKLPGKISLEDDSNDKSDDKAPKKFIQISIGRKAFPAQTTQPKH
jgi:hypothetical protein